MVQLHYDKTEAGSGPYYVPEITDSAVSVEISLELIETLGFETIEALKAIPKRGLEIGGILLGRFDAARSAWLIADREPVESVHLYGPSYSLSDADWSVFRQTLARLRDRAASDLRPAGFYRSHTRNDLEFDVQDNAVARDLFGGESGICLLVKPSVTGPGVAQIGMLADGTLRAVAQFPFSARFIREHEPGREHDFGHLEAVAVAAETVEPSRGVEPGPEMPALEVPVSAAVAGSRVSPSRGRMRLGIEILLATAMMLVGAFIAYRSRVPHGGGNVHAVATPRVLTPTPPAAAGPPPATDDKFALSVERQGDSTILSWNHDAPVVRDADHALLTIEDGRNRQQLHVNKAQLATGSIVYIPRGRDVNFRMQVFAPGGSATESTSLPASGAPVTGKHFRSDAQIVNEPPKMAENSGRAPAGVPAEEVLAEAVTPPAKDSAPAVAPPVAPSPVREAVAASGPAGIDPQAKPDPVVRRPPESRVITTVSAEFVTRGGVKGVLSKLSPGRVFGFHSGGGDVVPPRILRQVLPEVPAPLAAQLHTERQMDVTITVGTRGEVYRAEAADRRFGDPIGLLVLSAARQWNFEPARANGRAVESKVVLHFVLRRS